MAGSSAPAGQPIKKAKRGYRAVHAERVNLLYYWEVFGHAKLILFGVTIIAGLLGFGATFLITPMYLSTATILTVDPRIRKFSEEIPNSDEAYWLMIRGSQANAVARQALAMLRSQGFITEFIASEDLLGEIHELSYPGSPVPTLQEAYLYFEERLLRVQEQPIERVIRISLLWNDPVRAAELTNRMIALINEEFRSQAIAEAQLRLSYLEDEYEQTNITVIRNSINQLIRFQLQTIMEAETTPNYVFSVIDPAAASDPDEYTHPNRALMGGVATAFGFVGACMLAIWKTYLELVRAQLGESGGPTAA